MAKATSQGERPARAAKAAKAVRAKPRGRYHHGDLRRALLDAAVALVEREGRRALTLRGVARLLGVSQAAPYRHFADKEALLAAVAEGGLRALAAQMGEAAAARGADRAARLQALGVAYVEFAAAQTARFRVMFMAMSADEGAYPSLSEAYGQVFGLLGEAIAACQAEGLVRAGDPRRLALAAWSIVHGLAELETNGQLPRLGLEAAATHDLAASVTHALFVGLAPRGERVGTT